MVSDGAFMFHKCISCGKTFLWYKGQGHLQRSRPSITVTRFMNWPFQGHYFIFSLFISYPSQDLNGKYLFIGGVNLTVNRQGTAK